MRTCSTRLGAHLSSGVSVAALIAWLGIMAAAPSEPQSTSVRRYSQGGLDLDLPGDWQLAHADGWWNLVFRSATTGGEIVFSIWQPVSASNYWGSLESFVADHLHTVKGRTDVRRLKVSGLDAISFSERQVNEYRGRRVTAQIRETWIGVPDGAKGGTVFSFSTVVELSGPKREAELKAYERMLASMRIDPVALHKRGHTP
jgi:hypothetical protein